MVFDSSSRRGRLTGLEFTSGVAPLYHLPEIIQRLSAMGARDAIVELWPNATEAKRSQVLDALGNGFRAQQVCDALAHVGLTDLVLQLGAHSHWGHYAVVALINAGYIDDAMRHASRLVDVGARLTVVSALQKNGRNDLIDRVCRQWFGFPPPRKIFDYYLPPNSPFVTYLHSFNGSDGHASRRNSFSAVLRIWSEVLDQLGSHRDAGEIRRFIKQAVL